MNQDKYYGEALKGFDRHTKKDVTYFASPLLQKTGLIRHCFTARHGGISPAPFNSLNFSAAREKNKGNIIRNYETVAEVFGLDTDNFYIINYAHGFNIFSVDNCENEKGIYNKNMPVCDGLSSNTRGKTIITLHSDCLPLFFLDTKNRAIALCHAGWKGVYSHITLKAVDFMQEKYGTRPKDILAAIGPSIGPCCFEVRKDVYGCFKNEFGCFAVSEKDGKMFVDLWKACASDMMAAGIPAKQVNISFICNACDKSTFFSHRRDKGRTGAMMAFMQLSGTK